jgi:hypothetical protein
MEQPLSQFTIDDCLKRYTKALGHLPLCVPKKTFDDILSYIKKHELYQDGMGIYKDQRSEYDVPTPFLLR